MYREWAFVYMTPEISLSDIPKILPHLSEPEKNLILAELEKLEQMKVKERATEKFLVFVKEVWPQFISGRHHAKMADAFERVASGKLKRLIINMPPRHKLLISQEIPTTEGFKTMAEIQPGDCVFSPDGTPTLVTGKSAVYEEEIYEVTTIDGAVIKCDAEHLWTVRWGCGVDAPFKTISTAEILAHQRRFTGVNASAKLPPMSPLQMPERNFLVPPYVLGAWLGDGASASGSMAAHPDDMPHIRARFEAAGVETTDLSTPYIFGTKRLHVKLRKLGVIGNKHIPEEYFLGSESQRKELLQGLIDTDGGVGKCGKVTFHNSNLPLMEDVQLLVRSFGLKATIKERQTKGNHLVQNSKVSYRINFKMEGAASLPRKAERCKTLRGNWARTIRVAKTDRVGKVQCLEVANEDGLFLAGRGYVITHNTKSEFGSYLLPAWFLGKFPEKKIIQTSHTADLAVGFGRKVRNLVDSEPFEKIFPGVALRADSKAAARWDTNKNGSYFALGVGGAVTGKGADCGYFSCKVLTTKGKIALHLVKVGDKVRGYNHKTNRFEWAAVRAISTQLKPEIVNIGGFLCTPEHRVFTESGYEPASEARSVAVLQVQEDIPAQDERLYPPVPRIRTETSENLLFKKLRARPTNKHNVQLWEPEIPLGGNVQAMLPERQAHRPRRDEQHSKQCDNPLRTMPQPLSSSDFGACAEDFKNLLSGEGYWVVDLQTDTHNFVCEGVLAHNCFIIDDPHALEISTPIPTPKGFIEIQDLQVGDEVFGPDGGTTVVTAKSDIWHNRELYSVTTDDNQEILCDAKHLWGVNSDTCLDKARVDNLTAQYLAEWPRKSKPIIPKHQPVGYPEKELPIDPWVLGAWLGDGTSTSGRITADPKNGDQAYMMEEFKKAGYELSEVTADGRTFTVYGLQTQLKKLGVFNNKHVPVAYLQSSVGQRMALLQGLVDTDGAVVKSGQAGFYNCNVQLVDAVVELLHSLGVKCQRRTYKDTRGRWGSAQDNHRVMFRLQDCARIPRKQIYTRTPMDKRSRSITVENTLEKGSVQCISVAREDGLFLAGKGYVVTHNSEQEAAQAEHNPEIYDRVYEWYTSGPRQRLQPGGAMVIIATRWSKRDLVGRVLQDAAERGGEDWEVIEFPAILPSGNTLWPEFWPPEEIMALKEELPVSKWMAQYQQNPTSDVSAIVKREWWQKWEGVKPPVCEFVLTTWDTAFEKNNRADYSAMTTWGVFYRPNDATGVTEANIILLNAFRGKLEFPELKKAFLEHYQNEEPDSVIVEKKASGAPLIYEMRAMGIPVAEFTPTRGNDKISRLNMCSDLFASGRVWAPNKAWAEEVIEEVASFPAGAHDDYVDTVSMAMMRFRQGGYVGTNNDAEDEPEYFKGNKGNGYY